MPVGGGTADPNFIPNTTPASRSARRRGQFSIRLLEQPDSTPAPAHRAREHQWEPQSDLIPGAPSPNLLAAAPSNKITVNSVSEEQEEGHGEINAKVPGPGQATLNETNTPPDVNAAAAGVKQVGLTITQASSFKLAVKPTGKTAKKLNKQIKKQLKKKNKAKAKVNVTVFIHFVPAGVAGVRTQSRSRSR